MAADSGHIALIPSAGMGHLTPFLRFAANLVDHNCQVTLITIQPTISNAETQLVSRFLSTYPQVREKQLHLLPFDPSTANSTDPFWLRWEATRRSVSLLSPLLSSMTSPPISAIVYDISLMSSILPVVAELSLPGYVFFTASARMLSFLASFSTSAEPKLISGSVQPTDILEIPSLPPVTVSMIPPVLLNPKHLFAKIFREDSPNVVKSNGILINTFEKLEPESLAALNSGGVVAELPPVHAIGPLVPFHFEKSESTDSSPIKWLDYQPVDSVVFISFGSKTPTSMDQIREIGEGLAVSSCRFLWVVKTKTLDREEAEGDDLSELLGPEIAKKIKSRGLVVKEWVDQIEILAHNSVGGFLSHCGWNSVVEAAVHGVPILAWPQGGDQKINAQVVEKAGFGIWDRTWGWGMETLVKGDQIGEKIKELMESESLRRGAATVSGEATKAATESGSRERSFKELITKWKN